MISRVFFKNNIFSPSLLVCISAQRCYPSGPSLEKWPGTITLGPSPLHKFPGCHSCPLDRLLTPGTGLGHGLGGLAPCVLGVLTQEHNSSQFGQLLVGRRKAKKSCWRQEGSIFKGQMSRGIIRERNQP